MRCGEATFGDGARAYVPPEVRLRAVAASCIKASQQNWERAKEALADAVHDDPELLWYMLEPHWHAAAQRVLTSVRHELRTGTVSPDLAETGHIGRADHIPLARPAKLIASEGGGHCTDDPHARAAPTLRHEKLAAMDAVGRVAQASYLSLIRINGRPVGEATPREAREWVSKTKLHARFVDMLIQGVPEDLPIKDFVTPEEAEKIYKTAVELSDAA